MLRPFRIALAALFLSSLAHAQSTEAALQKRLLNHQFLLRGCWSGNNLWFSADGRPLNDYPELPFTLAGVKIDKLKLTKGALDLDAHRMGLKIDSKANGAVHWVPIFLVDAPNEKSAAETLHIHISAPANGDYSQTLDMLFADSVTDLAPRMPDYWQPAAKHFFGLTEAPVSEANRLHGPDLKTYPSIGTFDGGNQPAQSNSSTTQPQLVSGVNPEFTPPARRLRYRAVVTLNFFVEADGTVTYPELIAPAGLGLDEAAIAAVLKYKFRPGTIDGQAKRMQIGSSVSFEMQ